MLQRKMFEMFQVTIDEDAQAGKCYQRYHFLTYGFMPHFTALLNVFHKVDM